MATYRYLGEDSLLLPHRYLTPSDVTFVSSLDFELVPDDTPPPKAA